MHPQILSFQNYLGKKKATIEKLHKNRYFLLVIQISQIAIREDVEMRHLIMKDQKYKIIRAGQLSTYGTQMFIE